jgi:hypothetical protein
VHQFWKLYGPGWLRSWGLIVTQEVGGRRGNEAVRDGIKSVSMEERTKRRALARWRGMLLMIWRKVYFLPWQRTNLFPSYQLIILGLDETWKFQNKKPNARDKPRPRYHGFLLAGPVAISVHIPPRRRHQKTRPLSPLCASPSPPLSIKQAAG